MADEIAEKSIGEAGKAAGAAAAEGAASAFRDDAFGDPNVLVNRPEPKGSDTIPQEMLRGSSKTGTGNDRFGDILINRPEHVIPDLGGMDNKAIRGLAGGDIKHGIVTTYDENGNVTSDCFGPVPRPIGWPVGKPGTLGGIRVQDLPPISIDFGPKR